MNLHIEFSSKEESTLIVVEKDIARRYIHSGDFFLIADEKVASLYPEIVTNKTFMIKGGENSKSFAVLEKLLLWLNNSGCKRSDTLVAIGGGTIGDLAGFAASIYMRGIEWAVIPTTLLSMVDSSIGGKTGLNFNHIKNLVGSFHQPSKVLVDPAFLKSLSKEDFLSGLGEVIKYAAIADLDLFKTLLSSAKVLRLEEETINSILNTCCKIKASIVKKDPFEQDIRVLLNAGHTIGHAIESLSNNTISHGHAVVIGLYMEAIIGTKLGYTEDSTVDNLYRMFALYGYQLEYDFIDRKKLAAVIESDKKNRTGGILFPFVKRIGEADVEKVTIDELITAL